VAIATVLELHPTTSERSALHAVPDAPAPAGSWAAALEEYVDWLAAGQRSPGTIRLHRHYLGLLEREAADPWQVTSRQLVHVQANPDWGAETRKSCRSVFRTFYEWATDAGYVERSPAAGLPKVAVPSRTARPAPLEALRIGLERATAWQREGVRRERFNVRVMLLLAAYAGLRCVEIAAVHHDDYSDGLLYVTGKGGKRRAVPVEHPEVLAALTSSPGYLFPWREGHVTSSHVTRLMSQMLPDHWTGHTLRHRFATQAYAGTRDLLAVGQLLGHSRPETTQRYVRLPADALLAGVRAAAMADDVPAKRLDSVYDDEDWADPDDLS